MGNPAEETCCYPNTASIMSGAHLSKRFLPDLFPPCGQKGRLRRIRRRDEDSRRRPSLVSPLAQTNLDSLRG